MIEGIINCLWSFNKRIRFHYKLNKNCYLLEIHIVDHCNLNCKGCSHYSPISDEWYISLDDYENQIKKVACYFTGQIKEFHILGGEPLMHPEIVSIMNITRKYLQNDQIAIVTNGLLVKQMEEDFWNSVRKNQIIISITQYPCVKNFEGMMEYVKNKNVTVKTYVVKNEFVYHGMNEKGNNNWVKSYYKCRDGGYCLQVRNGKIYPCNTMAYVDILNYKFGTHFSVDGKSYLEIDSIKSSKDIIHFRRSAKRVCKYCNIECRKTYSWDFSKQERKEWIVDE